MNMFEYRLISRLVRLNHTILLNHRKGFSHSSKLCSFYEKDHRGAEYPVFVDKPWKDLVKESGKEIIQQFKLFLEETKEHFQQDRKIYEHGDTEVFFRFDSEQNRTVVAYLKTSRLREKHCSLGLKTSNQEYAKKISGRFVLECLKQWRISSDKMNKEGNSECSLIINDKKKAVFSGNVDLSPPKDGKNKFAGYCGIKSVKKMKSFFRDDNYDFDSFTHLELRVKGDGRNYAINLGMGMYFDVNWFDTYTYSIFTHGGPYWQVVRIPFSKFFLTSKGRIQDRQCPVTKSKINSIGITCAGVAGPFRLEIDYIGCHIDFRHKEQFAYEMYKIPKHFVTCD